MWSSGDVGPRKVFTTSVVGWIVVHVVDITVPGKEEGSHFEIFIERQRVKAKVSIIINQ